jgi:electron transfer flavoprotein beta subunit
MKLEVAGNTAKLDREIEGGKEFIEVDLPIVAGCQEPIAEWKIPNMRGIMTARSKPLAVVEAIGSPVGKTVAYENLPEKGQVKLVDPDNPGELIDLLKNEAKVL